MNGNPCEKDSDVTPLTNQELGHRMRSLERRSETVEQIVTELTVQAAKFSEHASHMRSLLEEVRTTNRWAMLLIVGTVLSSILALVLRDGSAHGTGSGSSGDASQRSTSTTSSGR